MYQKDPDDTLDYSFDWGPWLGGDTLASSTFDFVDQAGLVINTQSFDDVSSTVWLSAGTNGLVGRLVNRVSTAGGRTVERELVVAVQSVEGGPPATLDPPRIVLDADAFREQFSAFASMPTSTLQLFWDTAVLYMGDYPSCALPLTAKTGALNLLTAHLAALNALAQTGSTPAIVTMSRIDKIQVQLAAPPTTSGWAFWLATTPYGLQLWALLQQRSAGGFYAAGSPVRAGFRQVGGGFPGGRRFW